VSGQSCVLACEYVISEQVQRDAMLIDTTGVYTVTVYNTASAPAADSKQMYTLELHGNTTLYSVHMVTATNTQCDDSDTAHSY
jgi:hypothetical protein